jgi:L-threonylcarbamoyladenylate synthase
MNEDIKQAVKVLSEGGIILYPTDTIWGIGCDATNTKAVERIYKLKQRTDSKAMLVLLDNETRLQQFVREVPEIAWQLIEVTDKPLTLIYPEAKNLAKNLLAENGSIGIRITSDSFCQALISRFKKPIVSTSANISGNPSPAIFAEIKKEILEGVDYAVKWRQNETYPGQASSIIELGMGCEFRIIRR